MIVISHDPILHAPNCTGPKLSAVIHELTLAEVKQWDCGGAPSSDAPRRKTVPGTRMPTLDEVFALAPRGKFLFNIETKITPKRRTLEEAQALIRSIVPTRLTPEDEDRRAAALTLQAPEMTPPPEEFTQLCSRRSANITWSPA